MIFIFILLNKFFFIICTLFLFDFSFNSIILESIVAKTVIAPLIKPEIREEYKICGKLYIKLNAPFSSYIWCIVSSLKNNEFTEKEAAKLKKNRNIWNKLSNPPKNTQKSK